MTTRTFTALSLTAALAVAPGLAQAATWGGSANGGDPNVNYAYPNVSILFQQNSNRVGLRNAQVLMECVDRSDATVSIAAFSAGGPTGYSAPLRLNRWRKEFVSSSGGRTGQVTVTARMRPNGRGTARVVVEAIGRDASTGGIIDDCRADVTFDLRRFRAGTPPPWADGL